MKYLTLLLLFAGNLTLAETPVPFGLFGASSEATKNPSAEASPELSTRADLAAAEVVLLEQEQSLGPYHPSLAALMVEVAAIASASGDLSRAAEFYDRALHNARVNNGLYGDQQLPILRGLIALYLESGDREALEERAAYQFRLLGSGLPPFEEGELKAALEFFDVTLDVLMDVEWGPRGRELLQFHDRFDDMTAAVCEDPSVSSEWCQSFTFRLAGFYMGLELQSLALYVLATFNRDQLKSSEAGLKYFVLSALSSGLLLYGCSLIYGFSGSTNFDVISSQLNSSEYVLTFGIVFILVGLAFKISAVPFHMWAPDVYEGSPTSVTLFFTMVPKIAALTVFIRFLYVPFLNLIDQWQMIIIFLSIASMLFGAVAAIGQTNIKRLIAYSSIGHIGYTLAGLATGSNEGIQSSIIYITIYVIMNLALFSCLLMLKRNNEYYENIEDLSGLSKNHPLLSLSLLIILFSLAGIPPLAGFFAKFYIFTAVIEQSMYFLAIVGLLSTVIAAFYYLRIIKIIYFDKEKEKYDSDHSLWLKFSLTFSTILILLYFIFPSQLIEVVSRINII